MITRRHAMLTLGASLALPDVAHAAPKRWDLPNGGTVIVPSGYKPFEEEETYHPDTVESLIAYRNWRHSWSGYPECDGMIAVQRVEEERNWTLEDFTEDAGAALTVNWSSAEETPETRFTTETILFPVVEGEGPNGPELVQELSVTTVGLFDVYERPAQLYAVAHRLGVRVAVWILDSQGGSRRARRLADQIAQSLSE